MSFSYLNNRLAAVLILALVLVLSGCSTTGPLPPAGASLQNLVRLQTDPQLTIAAPLTSSAKLDGQQGAEVMRVFRTAIAKPVEVNNEIHVNIGN